MGYRKSYYSIYSIFSEIQVIVWKTRSFLPLHTVCHTPPKDTVHTVDTALRLNIYDKIRGG